MVRFSREHRFYSTPNKSWKGLALETFVEHFYDMLSEYGVDAGDGLSDVEFKQLIRRQYKKVKSIAEGDLC